MEALEFLKERKRMCRSFCGSCRGCPCEKVRCALNSLTSDDDYKRIVAAVEEWSAAHPRKTRQSVFLEQFPNARLDTNVIIDISPCRVDPKQYPSAAAGIFGHGTDAGDVRQLQDV